LPRRRRVDGPRRAALQSALDRQPVVAPRIRAFCADHADIFHYEVEEIGQIGEALRTIARVKPVVLVVNGGDGTVQTVLTEIHHGHWFGDSPPPLAVLPNGKTNLIALDLGSVGDPVVALERVMEIARTGWTRMWCGAS
jgi:diacylglycerol kinase family enzyme